jgi:two-component system, OmpR family, catabolic regulation response regulator CreB
MMTKILIVDDEPAISQTLEYALQLEGFEVQSCELGQQGLDIARTQNIDLIVLDVGLPDIQGFEVCKKLRQFSEVPVLFLTARNDEFDRILGLELGADDYVCKPFSPREVATRIKVILKRLQKPAPVINSANLDNSTNQLSIDTQKAKVMFYGQGVDLTKYEFLLLSIMHNKSEQVFSREQLMQKIWPNDASLERSVDTHIKSLRVKLRSINSDVEVIKTHRGLGYSVNAI